MTPNSFAQLRSRKLHLLLDAHLDPGSCYALQVALPALHSDVRIPFGGRRLLMDRKTPDHGGWYSLLHPCRDARVAQVVKREARGDFAEDLVKSLGHHSMPSREHLDGCGTPSEIRRMTWTTRLMFFRCVSGRHRAAEVRSYRSRNSSHETFGERPRNTRASTSPNRPSRWKCSTSAGDSRERRDRDSKPSASVSTTYASSRELNSQTICRCPLGSHMSNISRQCVRGP